MAKQFYKEKYQEKSPSREKKINLPGGTKAAIMLVAMGQDASAEIFKNLSEKEVEALSIEIAKLEGITPEMRQGVIEEFHHMALAQQYIARGGIDYARQILDQSVGSKRAQEILDRVVSAVKTTGFSLLGKVEPQQLVNFIQKEHPQTIALLLAHLDPKHAAGIISALPPETQVEVALRIATMESVNPEVLKQVEEVLSDQIRSLFGGGMSEIGGVKAIAEILNLVDRSAEKNILGNLERENPELATEVKNLMFVFEDVMLIDDRGIQRVLKEIEVKELAIALKASSDELKNKFFRNMSQRAQEMIREDMEFMGPVRLKDVEEAQQRIVDVARKLEEDGEIVISGRGGDDEIIV